MAQIAQIPSGIEVYTPQDNSPSSYVTNLQDQYPTAYNVSPPYHDAIQEAGPTGETGRSLEKSAEQLKAKESRICGVKRLTFWLCLAVGVLVVLVAVGGGALGSSIRKGSGSKSQLSISLSPTSTPFFSLSTSSSASPTSTSCASVAQPANDCTAFHTPYTVEVSENESERNSWSNAIFEIYCNTDYNGGDFTSFYATSLLTCMNGCAAFNYWQALNGELANMNCSGVVYGLDLKPYGNCYLKRGGYNTKRRSNKAGSYARLRPNSTS